MKKSLFLAIITTLIFLLCSSCSDGSVIHYKTNDGEKIEINRASFDAIIISHRYVDGVGHIKFLNKLTKISVRAFLSSNRLTNVTIPNSVTWIGESAFKGCTSLTSVTIGNGVTEIEESAFWDCTSLTRVDYKGDLSAWCKIDLGSSAANPLCNGARLYLNGSELTNITIPSDITEIKSCTFEGCTSLRSITIPDSVTSIGNNAFRECWLTDIVIPDSVTSIGDDAFEDCTSLESITIPDSVTSIGSSAFWDCTKLGVVYYKGDLSAWCKISFGGISANPLCNGARLYLNGSELTDITIPSDITEIKSCTFEGCTSLKSVTIPDSVTSIGDYAFDDCTSLTSITIPDSVTTIGERAFRNCDSLESITIPDSVTSIGDEAFLFCDNLSSVYCDSTTPPAGGNNMFSDYYYGEYKPIGCTIYVPDTSVSAYKAATYWKSYASYIEGYEFYFQGF